MAQASARVMRCTRCGCCSRAGWRSGPGRCPDGAHSAAQCLRLRPHGRDRDQVARRRALVRAVCEESEEVRKDEASRHHRSRPHAVSSSEPVIWKPTQTNGSAHATERIPSKPSGWGGSVAAPIIARTWSTTPAATRLAETPGPTACCWAFVRPLRVPVCCAPSVRRSCRAGPGGASPRRLSGPDSERQALRHRALARQLVSQQGPTLPLWLA